MPTKPKSDDPDDIFADTRMSFGDHIEELRTRLIKALKGLLFCLIIGFVLDGIGSYVDNPNIGIGRPVFRLITGTVEDQVRDFYFRRASDTARKLPSIERISPEEEARITDILAKNNNSLDALSTEDREKLLGAPVAMPVFLSTEEITKLTGPLKTVLPPEITVTAKIYPAYIDFLSARGEALLQSRKYLTTLSVQESFVVYFKVSLICGFVIGSPYIFYQIWAFVAAGLYPHEKRYVHLYLPASVLLFIAGIIVCQFLVLPGAVKALLGFNAFLDIDPDIRLNEWLGFALILPLVFGLSFQTPLVMMFFNRIGMFGWQDYMARWRGAVMILAIFAAFITPTPDAVTMLYLFIPMFSLYMLGVGICYFFPPSHEQYVDEDAQVTV